MTTSTLSPVTPRQPWKATKADLIPVFGAGAKIQRHCLALANTKWKLH